MAVVAMKEGGVVRVEVRWAVAMVEGMVGMMEVAVVG